MRIRTGAMVLVVLATLGACSSITVAPPSTSTLPDHRTSVPHGWNTYTFGKAAISVPSDWAVRRNTNCPGGSAPGTLLLGIPKVQESCPATPASFTDVAVTTLTLGTVAQKDGLPYRLNGVLVYVGMGSPTGVDWTVPSLGVTVGSYGPNTGLVLLTLRKA